MKITTTGKHKVIPKLWPEKHTGDYLGIIYNPRIANQHLQNISARWNKDGIFLNWDNPDYNVNKNFLK